MRDHMFGLMHLWVKWFPCLIEQQVVQPARPLSQQPRDRLGQGVGDQSVAEHSAVVLIQRSAVEPQRVGLGSLWSDIPAQAYQQRWTH